jgi:hypothetical protein
MRLGSSHGRCGIGLHINAKKKYWQQKFKIIQVQAISLTNIESLILQIIVIFRNTFLHHTSTDQSVRASGASL